MPVAAIFADFGQGSLSIAPESSFTRIVFDVARILRKYLHAEDRNLYLRQISLGANGGIFFGDSVKVSL